MKRRTFLAAAAITTLARSESSLAYNKCAPAINPAGQICEAGIEIGNIAYASQQQSQWCWAASISMIFEYYGFDIPQEEIVQAVYGTTINMPALSGSQISAQLNRIWQDQSGRRFRSRIEGLYDVNAGAAALNNFQIVQALRSERPLLMGNVSHAVVLTAVAYIPTPAGPNIVNVGMADPWPGVGLRGPQSMAELVPMHMGGALRYLALPRVQAV